MQILTSLPISTINKLADIDRSYRNINDYVKIKSIAIGAALGLITNIPNDMTIKGMEHYNITLQYDINDKLNGLHEVTSINLDLAKEMAKAIWLSRFNIVNMNVTTLAKKSNVFGILDTFSSFSEYVSENTAVLINSNNDTIRTLINRIIIANLFNSENDKK